ncbi:MAG: esterase/lipase family protein, partial [Promethearchaeota archaeon]
TYKNLAFYKFYLLFETIDDIISTLISIDGQTPVEISEFQPIDPCLAMVQLPIPANGNHQIQLFARNSEGDLYQTEVKEFNFDMEINFEGIQDGESVKGGDELNLKLNAPVELSELGYILDGEVNAIEGDSLTNLDLSINISEIGTHTIQAYGSDSYGNEYISESRSFITTPFNIIDPEDLVSLTEEGDDIDLIFNAYTFLENIEYSIDGQDFIAGEYSEKQISILCKQYSTSIGTLDRGNHTIQLKGTGKITGNEYYSELKTFEVLIHDISLICVHGYGGHSSAFNTVINNPQFIKYYGAGNIWTVNYVTGKDPEFDFPFYWDDYFVGVAESITTIAEGLLRYIIARHIKGDLKDNIDIFAHSMGGLVVRYMIKCWYPVLQTYGITIRHVGLAGTPNHGVWFANFGHFLSWNLGLFKLMLDIDNFFGLPLPCWYEMGTLSGFLLFLNFLDETPYDISYYTYSGLKGIDDCYKLAHFFAHFNINFFVTIPLFYWMERRIGKYWDGTVATGSTPISGAINHGPYLGVEHGALLSNSVVLNTVISDFKT